MSHILSYQRKHCLALLCFWVLRSCGAQLRCWSRGGAVSGRVLGGRVAGLACSSISSIRFSASLGSVGCIARKAEGRYTVVRPMRWKALRPSGRQRAATVQQQHRAWSVTYEGCRARKVLEHYTIYDAPGLKYGEWTLSPRWESCRGKVGWR